MQHMLKLKESIKETIIYVPFTNSNTLGKFIDPRLYKFLYIKFPDLFEPIKKENKITIIKED